LLDDAIDGIHGLNVVGGAPKVGKSCFMIQVATELARRSVPVIYYDFENGRQKIYQRTMARLSRVTIEALRRQSFDEPGKVRVAAAQAEFKKMLHWFRVVNDRKVTPEIMRRHVDLSVTKPGEISPLSSLTVCTNCHSRIFPSAEPVSTPGYAILSRSEMKCRSRF
jgi:replicative DNA helicase